MNNEEKAQSIVCFHCNQQYCNGLQTIKSCPKNKEVNNLLEIAQWKDEQVKQLLIEKTKLLSSSSAQDSVKRCTFEEIYRELFNEELPNSNPYIK